MEKKVYELNFRGRKLSVELGEVAKQAQGACIVKYEDTDAGTAEQRVYKNGAATQKQAVNITFNNGSGSKSDNTVRTANTGNTTNNKKAANTNTKGASCTGKNKQDSVQGSKVVNNTDKANSNTDSVSGTAISGGGVSQDQETESDDTVGGNAISGGGAPQDQEMDQEIGMIN